MLKYIGRRLLMLIPVLLGVTLIIFIISYITPGDPAQIILGDDATPENVAALREEMGLNDPFFVRYVNYIWDAMRGDLGTSYSTGQPVMELIQERFPNTLKLAVSSVGISITLGLIFGIIASVKQYSLFDDIAMSLALIGVSMPAFWLGLLLILVFSVNLGWFPPSGYDSLGQMILPAVTNGVGACAIIARMTRSSMLEVVRQDYITTARAKGQNEFKVVMRHAFKNALIPIINVVGLQFGALLGGSVLVESVFSIPGLGKLMVDAIKQRNFAVVQGGVLYLAVMFTLVNLAIDIIYAFVDPRVKSQYK